MSTLISIPLGSPAPPPPPTLPLGKELFSERWSSSGGIVNANGEEQDTWRWHWGFAGGADDAWLLKIRFQVRNDTYKQGGFLGINISFLGTIADTFGKWISISSLNGGASAAHLLCRANGCCTKATITALLEWKWACSKLHLGQQQHRASQVRRLRGDQHHCWHIPFPLFVSTDIAHSDANGWQNTRHIVNEKIINNLYITYWCVKKKMMTGNSTKNSLHVEFWSVKVYFLEFLRQIAGHLHMLHFCFYQTTFWPRFACVFQNNSWVQGFAANYYIPIISPFKISCEPTKKDKGEKWFKCHFGATSSGDFISKCRLSDSIILSERAQSLLHRPNRKQNGKRSRSFESLQQAFSLAPLAAG